MDKETEKEKNVGQNRLVDISVVIPVCNEAGNVKRTYVRVKDVLAGLGKSWEIIAVDDGSRDKSWLGLAAIAGRDKNFIAIRHMKNYGQSAAYQAGFDAARGEVVITVSADLDVDPGVIPEMLAKHKEGFDLVNAWRKGRWQGRGHGPHALLSGLANRMIAAISGVSVRDRGSGLKLLDRVLVENLKLYGDMHRFLPDYASLFGARVAEIPAKYQERVHGQSNYKPLRKTFKVFLDLLVLKFMLSFSTKPFTMAPGRIFGLTGLLSTFLGFLLGIYLTIVKLICRQEIGSRPLLMLAILLIILGVQFIALGLLGELMLRIYYESSGRRTYTVRERLN